jgi:hypothetical protein
MENRGVTEMSDKAQEPQWEKVYFGDVSRSYFQERTEKLPVEGGYLYRTILIDQDSPHGRLAGISTVFVPTSHFH